MPQSSVRVGFEEFRPYLFSEPDGRPAGLAHDVLTEAARRAHIRLQWVRLPLNGVDSALASGAIDLYPVLTVTEERKKTLRFTATWAENHLVLVSPKQRRADTPAQVAGWRVSYRDTPPVAARVHSLLPGIAPVPRPSNELVVEALCAGEAQAAVVNLRSAQTALLEKQLCAAVPMYLAWLPGSSLPMATAAAPRAEATLSRLDGQLRAMAEDGALSQLSARWGVFEPLEIRRIRSEVASEHNSALLRYALAVLLIANGLGIWHVRRMRQVNQRLAAARAAAEQSRLRFEAFMERTPAIAYIRDKDGRCVYANAAAKHHLADRSSLDAAERQVFESRQTMEAVEFSPDGEARWLTLRFPVALPGGGQDVGVLAIDITERERSEHALRLSEERFRAAVSQTGDSIFEVNSRTREMRFFGRTAERLGISPAALPATIDEFLQFVHPEDRDGFRAAVETAAASNAPFEREYRLMARHGAIHVKSRAAPLTSEPHRWIGVAIDVTDLKRKEAVLEHRAVHDALTGLPNRSLLEDRLRHAITIANRENHMLAVMFIDLDGFKSVNDRFGHAGGDDLLRQIAIRFRQSIREADTLARTGGDEFTLLTENVRDEESALLVAEKLLDSLRAPFRVPGGSVDIGASIGIAFFPGHASDAAALQRNADAAMYEAKRAGRNQIRVWQAAGAASA